MNHSEIDLSSFVFCSVLKGLWWSATGMLIAIWLIVTAIFLMAVQEFGRYDLSGLVDLAGGIGSFIFGTLSLTIAAFFMLGVPVTILPSLIGTLVLCLWLYHDSKMDKLSRKTSQWKGTLIGLLGGSVALFTPLSYFGWPDIWLSFAYNSEYQTLFWIILIVIPLAGGLTGRFLAKILTKELEPQGDYFSIDWEALQKEGQNSNLTPNT